MYKRKPSSFNLSVLKNLKKKISSNINLDTKKEFEDNIRQKGLRNGISKTVQFKTSPQTIDQLDPNSINDFYVNISSLKPDEHVILQPKPQDINPFNKKFDLTPFTYKDILNAWRNMNNHNSNSTSNNIMQHAMKTSNFVSKLTDIFNKFVEAGEVPECLKVTRIVSVPTCKNASSPNETRPISIQAVITKILD